MKKRYESDLYEPVEQYFMHLGYEVHAEVNDCDVVATKDDELIIIELKQTINMALLIQATKRQRLTHDVYIAIPKPTYSLRSRRFRDLSHLLRRLEIGLLFVSFKKDLGSIEVIHEPKVFSRARSMSQSSRRREQVWKEVNGRSQNNNVGGSHQVKIHTAYKENVIYIACCLAHFGPCSPKKLREIGTGNKTASILQKNYDGWFKRIKHGVYGLTDLGRKQYRENESISETYCHMLRKKHPLPRE